MAVGTFGGQEACCLLYPNSRNLVYLVVILLLMTNGVHLLVSINVKKEIKITKRKNGYLLILYLFIHFM